MPAAAASAANGAKGVAASAGSSFLSPNHPINLRKQAAPKLDSNFSVRSYIGGANALLEKAQAADAQGQLEVAFVNYLKAAGVASFISKHDDWPKIQKGRGPVYQAYNELIQQVPVFVERTQRVEEQLRNREEKNALQQREAQVKEQESRAKAMERAQSGEAAYGRISSRGEGDGAPAVSLPTASPTQDGGLDAAEREQGGGTDAPTIGRSDASGSRHGGAHSQRMSASLAERLQALRGAGVDGGIADGRKRSSSLSDGGVGGMDGAGKPLRSGDLATHHEALAEREDRDHDDHHGDAPEPPVARDGMASPTLPHDDSFSMHAVNNALRHYQPFNPAPSSSRSDGQQQQQDDDVQPAPHFPHLPSASEFESSYPTLDTFERVNGAPGPGAEDDGGSSDGDGSGHGVFPQAPMLPDPPVGPTGGDVAREFAIARAVPEPFSVASSSSPMHEDPAYSVGPGSSSASRRQHYDGMPNPARMSLQFKQRGSVASPPASLRPGAGAAWQQPGSRSPAPAPAPAPLPATANGTGHETRGVGGGSGAAGAAAASLIVDPKPSAPLTNHITVQDLFGFLYPGFEEFADADGNKKIGKRRGMDVLLLDIRSRQEWETCRIRGGRGVCIEPIILRDGMNSADLEDKLLLSPEDEQAAFAARSEADLVVLYDNNLRSLKRPAPGGPPIAPQNAAAEAGARARMEVVIKAIYETEFRKVLKHQPVLLVGGLESWHKALGEKGVIRERPAPGGGAAGTGTGVGRRTSISFEAGTRFPTADQPNSRTATAEQLAQQELKRTRRQQQILPDSVASPPLQGASSSAARKSGGVHPGSTGSSSSITSFGAMPGYGSAGTPGSFAPPSIPPPTYQSPGVGVGASLAAGAPSFPPAAATRPGDYFSGAPADRQQGLPRTNSSSTFDYPQLRQNGQPFGMSTPQPPPAAASSAGPSASASSGRSSKAASISISNSQTSLVPASAAPASAAALGYAGYQPAPSRMYSGVTTSNGSGGGGRSAEDVRIGLTGLKNLGNSCYMNSTLQCLSATIPLARFLLDGSYKRAINKVNPLGTQGALAEAFAQLVRVMWSEQYTFVSPVTFREAIARFAPAFRGCDQHDSQEFLAFLLDGLHEDLNYVVHKPPPIEMTPERETELETLPQQVASVKEWGIYRMRNDSLIVDWFQGQFRNKMTCLTCGKTSTTYNAFMYLSLPIPSGRNVSKATLQQCLDAFVREEILDKADAWNCPRCKKPRKASKRLSISRLPQVLLIHLKRFSFKGPFTDKIDTTVTFPTSGLDLTNYMPPPLPPGVMGKGTPVSASQQPPYLYDLYGVTHHFGSLNTGHYTATIRDHGDWWYCDDSRISKSDDRQIQTNSPYVLWFRRRPND